MTTESRIDVEHANTTVVRLDLEATEGRTTVGRIREWLFACQNNGAHDDTWALITFVPGMLLGGGYRPILAAHIDHLRNVKPAEEPAA